MTMPRKYSIAVLLLIVIAALFLRLYKLSVNPPSLTWDEAAWGYNAYSIGIDGRDEFERFLPLNYLESFGDFKPPVYAYLDVLPVKIFGLNEFAVRFPSALFGVLTVIATYFLVKRIFWKSKLKESYALMSALILAISPWHIMLSRAAFEANVATFFIVLGILLFFAGIQKGSWLLLLSVASFVFSIYTFNTARVVAPILLLILAFAFRKNLLERKRETLFAIFLGIILILPTVKFLVSPQASLRFKEVNIFSDIGVIQNTNQEISNDNNAAWSKIIHNRRFAFVVSYLSHYFDNLNPGFLFIKGDGNPKFSTQTIGEMFLWDLPFFVAGIFLLFRKKEGYWWIIPVWLIIGIVPAATARETPHALRIETTLPTFQMIVAYGVVFSFEIISKIKYQILKIQIKYLIFSLSILFLIFNFLYFYHDYLVHYPRIYSGEWQYGYKESIKYVSSVYNQYSNIEVTTDLGRPYIYYLFYTKKDPRGFRKTVEVTREIFGFVNVKGYDKYLFMKDLKIAPNKKVLYVNSAINTPKKAKILKTFYLLNGDPVLKAYAL